jgi:hypothetical protein
MKKFSDPDQRSGIKHPGAATLVAMLLVELVVN